jgi:hypothetical protein
MGKPISLANLSSGSKGATIPEEAGGSRRFAWLVSARGLAVLLPLLAVACPTGGKSPDVVPDDPLHFSATEATRTACTLAAISTARIPNSLWV